MSKNIVQQLTLASKFLKKKEFNKEKIKKMLDEGRILVNGEVATKDTVLKHKDDLAIDDKVYRVLVPDMGHIITKKNIAPVRIKYMGYDERFFARVDERVAVRFGKDIKVAYVNNQLSIPTDNLIIETKKSGKNTYLVIKPSK